MRKTILWSVALFVTCGLMTGCGGKNPALQMAESQNELADILKGVTDKKTAEDAKPKVKAWGEKFEKIMDEMKKKYPDSSKEPDVSAEDKKKVEEASKKVQEEMGRIAKIEGGADLAMEVVTTMAKAAGGKK